MRNLPFLIPLAALVSGILLADYAGAEWVTVSLLAIFSGFLAVCMTLGRRHGPVADMRVQRLKEPALCALFMAVGLAAAILARPRTPDPDDPSLPRFVDVRVTRVRHMTCGDVLDAEILGFCENARDSVLSFKPEGCGMRLTLKDLMLQPGDVVRFPHDFSYASSSGNYFRNDFEKQMRRKGIFFSQTLAKGEAQLLKPSHTLATITAGARDNMSLKLENSRLSHRTSSLVRTILLGDNDAISADDREDFAASGLAHMLSLSGMHIGIVAALVLFLLLPFNLTGNRKLRFLFAMISVWIYVVLTGMHLSAIRAAIMLSFYIGALCLERDAQTMNALLAAAFVILLFDPNALYDCGFQLSCICVFSLVGFTQYLLPDSMMRHPAFYTLLAVLVTTLLATLGSWAVVAYHFSRLPLMFLPANIMAAPLVPLLMGSGALIMVLESVGLHSHMFADFVNRIADLIYFITDLFADDSYSVNDLEVSALTAILWVAFVILLFILLSNKGDKSLFRRLSFMSALLLTFSVLSIFIGESNVKQNGIIVHDNVRELTFSSMDSGKEDVIRLNGILPADTVINGKTIAYINDRMYYIKSKNRRPVPDKFADIDMLIVGNRFYGSMDDILQYYKPEIVVGHKSLTADIDISLQCAAERLGVNYHSIREQGPYRLEW